MAEGENEDRTEQASEKRLEDAREKGEVPRSRDLAGALVVLAGVSAMLSGGSTMYAHARQIYTLGLSYSRTDLFSDRLPLHALSAAGREAVALLVPIFAATAIAALAEPVVLGGLNFSVQALQPNFGRLDPIAGVAKMFSLNSLVELSKSLLKLLFIGGTLVLLLRHDRR